MLSLVSLPPFFICLSWAARYNFFSPSREFVNDVGSIKILSPTEVLQMGKEEIVPTSPFPSQGELKKIHKTCDDCMDRQDLRNPGNGIAFASIGSLDF